MIHAVPTPNSQEGETSQVRDTKVRILLDRLGLDAFPRHDTLTLPLERIIVPGAELIKPSPSLIKSITLVGVLQSPSVVRVSGESVDDPEARFQVIFGRRRVLAARITGRTQLKFEAYEQATPQLIALLGLIENEQRSTAWMREIRDLRELIDGKVGMTLDELVAFGFGRNTLATHLKLAQLPEALFTSLVAGTLTQAAAKRLIRLTSAQIQQVDELVQTGEHLTDSLVESTLRGQVNAGLQPLQIEIDDENTPDVHSTDDFLPVDVGNSPTEEAAHMSTSDAQLCALIEHLHAFEHDLLPGFATQKLRLLAKALVQELEVSSRSTTPVLKTQKEGSRT